MNLHQADDFGMRGALLALKRQSQHELAQTIERYSVVIGRIEDHRQKLQTFYGEFVCLGCLLPWSVAHHTSCSGPLWLGPEPEIDK